MAQPEYVPSAPKDRLRVSERLPTPEAWHATRPAEVVGQGGQPSGPRFGVAGPDQGYVLKLARLWEDKLVLAGEHREDVVAGCMAVALKRAALYGRAPITYDLELAFGLFGYLDATAPAELVALRKSLFESCAHDYNAVRDIADWVPEATLRMSPVDVRARVAVDDWRTLLRP